VADADPNAPDAEPCVPWGAHFYEACEIVPAQGDLVLDQNGTYVYDTVTGSLVAPNGSTTNPPNENTLDDVKILSVQSLVIGPDAILRPRGRRPLIIAANGSITVDGAIDVSSSIGDEGAGANVGDCDTAISGGTSGFNSGSGGGGGGFGSDGGDGGGGDGVSGGTKGASRNIPIDVRGGCPGRAGAKELESDQGTGGVAGPGGGGIVLAARTEIIVDGTINAGGGGGGGGTRPDAGGGGAGSGGLIGFDSISVVLNGGLAANGGGGGQGADLGDDGETGTSGLVQTEQTPGGDRGGAGGDGGDGGSFDQEDGLPGVARSSDGGGGGGGGYGYILFYKATPDRGPDALLSPAPVASSVPD
jgi:hypothetical protein